MHVKRSLTWSSILLVPYFALLVPVQAGDLKLASELVANNLDYPVFLTHAPGDFDRLFVVEQCGVIRIIKDGIVLDEPFLDLTDEVNSDPQAWGLMAVTFHPDYQTNGFFYVLYTGGVLPEPESIIARYQVSANPEIGDPDSGQLVVNVWSPAEQHHGDWIGFGPNDGYLYFSHGDGHGNGEESQNINSLLGKILRLDVNGDDFPDEPDRNYAIPPTNPFVGEEGADEVWAYGIRQPWRCSFDRQTGDLYFGDVGPSKREEINFQPASSRGGENYGWDCKEGTQCHASNTCECADPMLVDPIFEYENPPDESVAVIGGYVYRGCAIPDLDGAYLFTDYVSGQIWLLRHEAGKIIELEEIQDQLDLPGSGKYASFGEDALGELYICQRPQGRIFRIIPSGPVDPDCNNNGVSDACDIANGTSVDLNNDGIPDECEGDTVGPDDFSAFRGFYDSGDLGSLLESDDDKLCYNPGIVLFPIEAPITLDFFGTLPNDSPASIDVTIESSANTVGLELIVSFWNFNTNSWDVVGTDTQSLNADVARTFAGIPADHVEAGTGAVRTRYEVRMVSFIFLFPWLDCVDHVFWTTVG